MSKMNRMAVGIALALFVMYSVWEFGQRGDWYLRYTGSSFLHTLGAAFAVWILFRTYRNSRGNKHWLYYGAGAACYFGSHLYWTSELLISGGMPRMISPASFLWILQQVFFILALFQQNRNRQEPSVPYVLDILLFLTVSLTVYWQIIVQPALQQTVLPEIIAGFFLFCSAVNLVMLLGLLLLFTYDRSRMSKSTTALLAAGFVFLIVGNSLSLYVQGGRDTASAWFGMPDYCWFLGMLFIGLSGAFDRQTADAAVIADAGTPRYKSYIPLAVGGILLLLLHASAFPSNPLAMGSLFGVALLSLRMFVGIRHTEAINRTLRETNHTYRTWTDNALVGVFIEQEGILVYVNRYCEELFGHEPGKMLGESILSYIAFPDVPRFLSEAEKLKDKVPTTRFEVNSSRNDHSTLYMEMHLATTYFGGKEALSGTLIDITERKMSEQYLIRSEKLSVVGQLAAGVAHEIRNPLTALKGFMQLLHRNSDDNRKYYEIMLTELERINYIVGEFMVLSKPHNRQQLKENDIHRILMSIIPILESQAILHNVIIRVESADNLPKVKCDENQIKQVLINLMKNAIESMPGGGTVTVRYDTDVSKRQLIVHIEDQGMGIPPELLERLGEPFLTTKEKGTGLGLMVCYKIVEAHEGIMSISSQPGQGTGIKLALPAR